MENNYAGIFQESITSSPLDSSLHKLWNEREKIFSLVTTELKLMQAQQRTAEDLEQLRRDISTPATRQSLGGFLAPQDRTLGFTWPLTVPGKVN